MPALMELKPWNSPHLLTNLFQLLTKLIEALNTNIPPEKVGAIEGIPKEFELKIIDVFSHQMMPAWFALAKSFYPFYKKTDQDKTLIEALEHKLNITCTNYESLSVLIKNLFLIKYPKVHSQYQPFIDSIETVMAKLIAVALSTPALLKEAHKYDKKKFEDAGPSMSNCISPIETILRHLMGKKEIDKSFIIAANLLLLHVKEIKSHFAQITLIQQLENTQKENKKLQKQLGKIKPPMQFHSSHQRRQKLEEGQNQMLRAWQSKKQQKTLVHLFQLQKRVNRYYDHLTDVLAKSPKDKAAGAKLATLTVLKNEIDKNNLLPSQRIETFEIQLDKAKEELKDHRDPTWLRFLRDCLRILGLVFSGVAIYKKLTNQSVNFFKPSHGQCFVEESNRILATHHQL